MNVVQQGFLQPLSDGRKVEVSLACGNLELDPGLVIALVDQHTFLQNTTLHRQGGIVDDPNVDLWEFNGIHGTSLRVCGTCHCTGSIFNTGLNAELQLQLVV